MCVLILLITNKGKKMVRLMEIMMTRTRLDFNAVLAYIQLDIFVLFLECVLFCFSTCHEYICARVYIEYIGY